MVKNAMLTLKRIFYQFFGFVSEDRQHRITAVEFEEQARSNGLVPIRVRKNGRPR